ncbi:MAG TPA: glutamyl-tRNA reductase [Gemmatimonadaceae bacterium]|nr:glutamyl-tRNA reductase [Gemmatimonadaceae bacterium]
MALIVAGVNYRTAPIAVRERLVVGPREVAPMLAEFRARSGAREVVLLSTCNRTELYAVEGDDECAPVAWSILSERLGREEDVARYGYVRRDREAVAHLYRVAAGMDSMILGEVQIHAQVRDAWETSRSESRAVLNRLFQSALQVGSRVRTETAISRGAASASSAAVQLSKKIFGSLQGRRAMVLGAGEMAELALECLMSEGVHAALVANRTFERAAEMAERHGATAVHYDECWARLHEVDVLLCSTWAPHAVVEPRHVAPTLKARGDRPLCILDIALPRDVDSAVGELGNVFLYDLDDLRAVVSANIERRRDELPSAERVIAAEVEIYWTWLAGLAAVPVLTTFRSQMDGVRARELAHALRRMEHLSPRDREAVEHFSRALMNKFLHEPSVRLRAAAANGRGLAVVDALRYLFALDEHAPSDDAEQAPPSREP